MFLDVGKPILGEALPMAHALHVNCEFYGTNCVHRHNPVRL